MIRRRLAILLAAAAVALLAPAARAAPVIGQGVDLTGARSLMEGAATGRGLVIAVVDLGFGRRIAERQREGELPPPGRLVTRSFDDERGLAGANAFGNRTAHGEEVAQVVYDYAPGARYLFANYHTPDEFLAMTRWLSERRPDIVVHANNFIVGAFDGTGPAAAAVDRLADAGILWFNSAGNYGLQHWRGPWRDGDADGAFDGTESWRFTRKRGETVTVAVSWPEIDGTEPTDLDLVLERATDEGWTEVTAARGRQLDGAPASEHLNGVVAPVDGIYRVRTSLRAGPPPEDHITLISRELALTGLGPTLGGSVPTPADSDGAIAVGAVDWRTDALKAYSSRGPSPDGRLKPDLVAPTGTLVRAGTGARGVGGTSIAAPNAAGAAAVLLWALREAGLEPSANELRAELVARARDLGDPGPDARFGHGLIRLDDDPPFVQIVAPPGPVSGRVRIAARIGDASAIRASVLALDGQRLSLQASGTPVAVRWIDTRRLLDGPHTLDVTAIDAVRNRGSARRSIVVDNTPPTLRIRQVRVGRGSRLVSVSVVAGDRTPGALTLAVVADGRRRAQGSVRIVGSTGTVRLGALPAGAYRLGISVTDIAGNTTRRTRLIRVRPSPRQPPPGPQEPPSRPDSGRP